MSEKDSKKFNIDNDVRYVGLDPSTKCGLVILDKNGEPIFDEEIKVSTTECPQVMIEISKHIERLLRPNDKVLIEGFAYGAKSSSTSMLFGIGWHIRSMLFLNKIPYKEVAPTRLKSFACQNGRANKKLVMKSVEEKWDFVTSSDNIADAYVLARMCYSIFNQDNLLAHEREIIKKIIVGK